MKAKTTKRKWACVAFPSRAARIFVAPLVKLAFSDFGFRI
jgi:hypothetical protein